MNFIEKARLIHGDKYNYLLTKYENNYTKVIIICPEHGEFEQTPNSHLSGHGCPLCNKFCNNKNTLKDNFIFKAKAIHGTKYDYSKVNYQNNKKKVIIICPEHGEFEQTPKHHLSGHGCNKCSKKSRIDVSDFIIKAKLVHRNKYDYSKVNYINVHTKIIIICPEHGEFEQTPAAHLWQKNGCPKCSRGAIIIHNTSNTDEFIAKAKSIHGDKYDYSKVDYKDNRIKITIICPEHGEFEQTPMGHLSGSGCSKCAYGSWDKDEFIERSRITHGDRYDYSLVDYKNANINVKIICKKHGVFEQSPYSHVSGSGCSKCGLSTGQKQIYDYITNIFNDDIILNDRKIINPYEIDIYMPSLKLGIEYNGLYWHSQNETRSDKNRHQNKYIICEKLGINLFQIWEHQWQNNRKLIESMISGKLKLNNKIWARKCKIKILNINEYKNFVNQNHLQGFVGCNAKIGLTYNDELVCVGGFSNINNIWEISRFCSKKFNNIVGGFSRILNFFIKNYKPSKIISYANLDHSNGSLYEKNNFKLIKITEPGYFYYKNGVVYSRQQFQKHKLSNKLKNFDEKLSELQNMLNNGYRRCWNSGNKLYIFS